MLRFLFFSFVFAFSCLPLVSLPFWSTCKYGLDVAWNHNRASQKISFLPIRIVRQWQALDKLLFESVATHRTSTQLRIGETAAAADEGESRIALCQVPPLSQPCWLLRARATAVAGPTRSSWKPSWGHTGWSRLLSSELNYLSHKIMYLSCIQKLYSSSQIDLLFQQKPCCMACGTSQENFPSDQLNSHFQQSVETNVKASLDCSRNLHLV